MRATASPTPLVDDLKCLVCAKAVERRSFARSRSQPSCACPGSFLGWTVHRRFDKCTAPGRLRSVPRSPERRGCVAQLVEQLTLNQRVQGSNPCTPTNEFSDLAGSPMCHQDFRAHPVHTALPLLSHRANARAQRCSDVAGPETTNL